MELLSAINVDIISEYWFPTAHKEEAKELDELGSEDQLDLDALEKQLEEELAQEEERPHQEWRHLELLCKFLDVQGDSSEVNYLLAGYFEKVV